MNEFKESMIPPSEAFLWCRITRGGSAGLSGRGRDEEVRAGGVGGGGLQKK